MVVDHLNSLDPKPDLILATGDLTDNGTRKEYKRFREITDRLTSRLLPFPGNHDESSLFRNAFSDLLPVNLPEDHCSYVVEDGPVRLVGIDTSRPGQLNGLFDDTRATWLDETLGAAPDKPTLVFTHFPPVSVGLKFMDISGLDDMDRFGDIILSHQNVVLVVAGHLHRPVYSTVGDSPLAICPSTGFQLELNLHPDQGGAVDEPPGFLLHNWNGQRFSSHTGIVRKSRHLDLAGYVAEVFDRVSSGQDFPKPKKQV